jgi:23S rRNA-/tRNA-specific pseudouridylate synthase
MSSFEIVFQSDSLLAIDKPHGWLTIPSRLPGEDSRTCLGSELEKKFSGEKIFPIHRLDAEVSGLVLFARKPDVHRALSVAFEKHHVRKLYSAYSFPPTQDFAIEHTGKTFVHDCAVEQIWTSKILRGKKRAYESPVGKMAETWVARAGTHSKGWAAWWLEPRTGRGHQLRYEFYKRQMPMVGDSLYGSMIAFESGIALRSTVIQLPSELSQTFRVPERFEVKPLAAFPSAL